MDHPQRLGTLLGVAALVVALVGVTLLLAAPASADPDGAICENDQGLMTSNLGI